MDPVNRAGLLDEIASAEISVEKLFDAHRQCNDNMQKCAILYELHTAIQSVVSLWTERAQLEAFAND